VKKLKSIGYFLFVGSSIGIITNEIKRPYGQVSTLSLLWLIPFICGGVIILSNILNEMLGAPKKNQ
jgi:hypothetical protein